MKIKVRAPAKNMVIEVEDDCTLALLRAQISTVCGLDDSSLKILGGYPPRPFTMDPSTPVSSFLSSGEAVTVRGQAANEAASKAGSGKENTPLSQLHASKRQRSSSSNSSPTATGVWACTVCTLENKAGG